MTTTLDTSGLPARSLLPFLDREHTIARPGYSRWLVPPAALCVHLCIGQAYAFSVFNLPMTQLIGITQSAPGDWKLTESAGSSPSRSSSSDCRRRCSARWVETAARARRCSPPALLLGGGFLISALGVHTASISGSSISATACSAASGSASATSRRSRR